MAPTRLVFEGRARTAELTLVNTGQVTTTYRISFVQLRMRENGSFEEITEAAPGEAFADKLVRYSPRQVVLEPGVAQTVRLQLRKPADLTPGEYRSHLVFRAVPPADESEGRGVVSPGVGLRLIPVYGVSIPVIVRHLETSASVSLGELTLQGVDSVALTIHRRGTASVYGSLRAVFYPNRGTSVEVGIARGVAVYTPGERRRFILRLHVPDGHALRRGVLRVDYFEQGGKQTLASGALAIP